MSTHQTIPEAVKPMVAAVMLPPFYPYGVVVLAIVTTLLQVLVFVAFRQVRHTESPDQSGRSESGESTQAAREPDLHARPIPTSEIKIETRQRQGYLYVWLWNEKAEPKTGISLRVTATEYYSENLEQGRGGFVSWAEPIKDGPIRLRPIPNKDGGALVYDKPHWYELIRTGSDCAIVDPKAGKRFVLREARHRFQIEVRWKDCLSLLGIEVDVVSDGDDKRVVVVNQAV